MTKSADIQDQLNHLANVARVQRKSIEEVSKQLTSLIESNAAIRAKRVELFDELDKALAKEK
jgi:regulator of replication initiation timing